MPTTPLPFAPLILLGWLIALRTDAFAQEPPPPVPDPATTEAPHEKMRWTPVFVPGVGFNSIDGLGIGLGGQMFGRPQGMERGYRWLLGAGLWTTTDWRYQAHTGRFEYRSDVQRASGILGYRNWENLRWAGVGGARAIVNGGAEEGGSALTAVHASFAYARPLRDLPVAPFAQVYARRVVLDPGGPLADDMPYGSTGGTYGTVALGLEADATDQWPLPAQGVRAEASFGAGVLIPRAVEGADGRPLSDPTVRPVGLAHLEAIVWRPLLPQRRRLVLGLRLVADHALGNLPVFEQSNVSGRWRDELGGEQLLSGYGRTRTRGDGVVAGMVELRPLLLGFRRGSFELDLYASAFVEQAWLFQGWDPGPPMPTLGGGPQVLLQGALQIRPFIAWGWRSDELDGSRRPVPQFGVSFFDPL